MLVVVVTFLVVISGGNVTSRDAGLAVPDGFTVYGHFLWSFPVERWVGNIFHEHIHRLKGSLIGMLTIGLAVWLYLTQRQRPWLRMLGLLALLLVVVQGALGGLRVDLTSTTLAVVHGVTAQIFLCVTVVIAAATGRLWIRTPAPAQHSPAAGEGRVLWRLGCLLLAVLLVQLVLGAAMRHTQAGLAIPDFPSSYGQLVPPLSAQGIERAIDELPYDQVTAYYSPVQVGLHFAHRVWAVAVLAAAALLLGRLGPLMERHRHLVFPVTLVGGLLILQIALGALVIWTGRQPEMATAHQATGAAILAAAVLLVIRMRLAAIGDRAAQHQARFSDDPVHLQPQLERAVRWGTADA